MNVHPDEADDTNVDTAATRNAPVPVGGIRRQREAMAAADRDQEAQVAKRLSWAGAEGRSVDQIAASLDWPGGNAGVLTVLRRLQRDGRARPLGDGLWTSAPTDPPALPTLAAPVDFDPDTTAQEAPVSTQQDRIADYLAAHPNSAPKDIAAALNMPRGTVSNKLSTCPMFYRSGDGVWSARPARDQEPVKSATAPSTPAPVEPPPEPAAPIKMPTPESTMGTPVARMSWFPVEPPPEVASEPPAAHGPTPGSGFAALHILREYRDQLRAEVGELQDEVADHKARIRACRREAEALELAALRIDQAIRIATGAA